MTGHLPPHIDENEIATDEFIARLEEELNCQIDGFSELGMQEYELRALIARIHAETEARKAAESEAAMAYDEMHHWRACTQSAEELARSIRHTTIQECADLAHGLRASFLSEEYARGQPASSFSERFGVGEYFRAILALLEPKP